MNFYWNYASASNLRLDLLIVFSYLAFLAIFTPRLRRPESPDLSVALRIAALTLLHALVANAVIAAASLSGFAHIRYFWTMLSVAAPLLLLWLWRRSEGRMRKALLVSFGLLLLLKLYAEAVEPRRLEVEELALEDRRIDDEVRIVHLSDLQTDGIGPMHRQVQEAINAFHPHLIVFTGDVLNHRSLVREVADYLHDLSVPGRSYLIRGDHDAIIAGPPFARASGFRWFDGGNESISVGRTRLRLLGLGRPDLREPGTLLNLTAPRRGEAVEEYTILLSHPPDAMFAAERRRVDLLLAGHTHGGQVVLPFFGPPLTLSRVPRQVAAGGRHQFGELQVFVSRGLGMEGGVAPRIRFLCRPHLALITLRRPTTLAQD